jgi:hypothetical protein
VFGQIYLGHTAFAGKLSDFIIGNVDHGHPDDWQSGSETTSAVHGFAGS